jgi:glycosyltransferase involved in cell wall biosynthesis
MQIAIDVHSLGSRAGGNETYYQQLLRGLVESRSKHQFTLFYTHPEAMQFSSTDDRFRWVPIPQNRLLRLGLALPLWLRHYAPDIFHCQYIAPLLVNSKLVVTIHDLAHEHYPAMAHPFETLAMRKLVRATAMRADCILTVSQFSATDIARTYQIDPAKITVASPAVSEQFHPRDKKAAQESISAKYRIEPPFILYVGRIQERKNLVRLVEAYASLQLGPLPKLLMIGKRDWGFEQLEEKIRSLRLEDRVLLPGYIAPGDLPLFYNAAEIFVFPSIFEGFGLPVLEAMASGTPTITSHGSSLEEVAGDSALLVDPFDVNSISKAIERVLKDADLRRCLVARGQLRSAEFTVQNFGTRVLDVYSSLL